MTYIETIRQFIANIPAELVDFSQPRDVARTPTQASSNFITNKEQGDWAEELILCAINETFKNYVAVKYGKSDDLVAGEEGFDKFFEEFQNELDTIGKRPDLLIFKKADFKSDLGYDISHIPHIEIDEYVKKAVAGIEVRSSAFLIERYDEVMQKRVDLFIETALEIRDTILADYMDELSIPSRLGYVKILKDLTRETLGIADFKVPGWRSTDRLIQLNTLFKNLKSAIKEIQKRDYLSITPKVEDIKVVYKWIETFNQATGQIFVRLNWTNFIIH